MICAAVATAVMVAVAGIQAQPVARPGGDEAAIRAVVKAYLDARETGNEAAVRALFTEDADQLTSSGEWRKGRQAIVAGTLASSRQASGARTIAIEAVRFPSPDVAIADGRYEIAGGSEQDARRMWTMFLLTKRGKDWRIAAIRNMLPAPPAAAR
jgi:uncharacterized protein (TIGR02246 family)